jgi:hypothetical protein
LFFNSNWFHYYRMSKLGVILDWFIPSHPMYQLNLGNTTKIQSFPITSPASTPIIVLIPYWIIALSFNTFFLLLLFIFYIFHIATDFLNGSQIMSCLCLKPSNGFKYLSKIQHLYIQLSNFSSYSQSSYTGLCSLSCI